MATVNVNLLRSAWSDGDDSDGQETAVSSTSPSPMSLATLVGPPSHRSSWFSQVGSVSNRLKKPPTPSSDHPSRRASVLSTSRGPTDKLKDVLKGKDSVDSSVDGTVSTTYDLDSASTHPASSPVPPQESSSRSSSGTRSVSSPAPKKRGSLLVTATDVFGFRFARRRKSVRQSSMPIVLPDVIEISASRRDDEVEERERLRDVAAQSIGLDPILMSTEDPVPEVDETETSTNEHRDSEQTLDNYGTAERYSPELSHSRKHSYTNTTIQIPKSLHATNIPDFPSTITILTDFTQASASLIKYYPSTSLRLFALGKNWKARFLVLSSSPPRASQGASPSFLHLFRSSHPEEKELERLEINEESVVFVSDEDVGGRKNVVKVGGVDIGASKGVPRTDGPNTMWFLQISDPPEAQRWITLIKNIILGQRSMRAGLGIPASTQNGNEPRGDMDVMLSMRAQGIITSLTVGSLKQTNFSSSRSLPAKVPHPFSTHDQNCGASISSQSSRSQAPSPKPQVLAVSALKGLFSTRPRSPSQSVSTDEGSERGANEDSFGNVGTNLLSLARPNGSSDIPSSSFSGVRRSYHTSSILDYRPNSLSSEQRLDRKIVPEQQGTGWPVRELPLRPNRALSVGSFSLQPAPRRRPWTIGTQALPSAQPPTSNGPSTKKSESSSAAPPPSPSFSGFSFGTPEQRTRAPSLRSVSTLASGDNGSNMDRSSSSTKTRRWSRQGSVPKRLSPPNGPPPAIPQSQSPRFPNSNYPYLSEEGEPNYQSSSSIPSATSQASVLSGLPSFSKRNSNSSGLSVSSGHASQQYSLTHAVPRAGGAHRTSSVPPPRPAPTFAPPPAPDYDASSPRSASTIDSAFSPRSPSFRSSFSHRSFRLSLTAPKPPPLTNLPPRPDEPEYPTRVSSSSSSSNTRSMDLYSIPGSPIPKLSPKPPPTYPLPPTPAPFSISPVTRNPSFKQRLRILSAPSPTTVPSVPEGDPSPGPSSLSPLHHLIKAYQAPGLAYTPPTTPIGEQITQYQDDPSFLQIHTPIATRSPEARTVRRLPLLPDQNVTFPEVMSLSPPPRRGTRQLPLIEMEDSPESKTLEVPSVLPDNDKLMSLSRHGSVISLGIVSM